MSDIEKHQDVQQEKVTSDDGSPLKTIDTVHQDEAMRVLATYQGPEEWTEQEEKSLRRKIDLRLMPVLCLTYGLQYYDKAMLSQAVSYQYLLYLNCPKIPQRLCLGFALTYICEPATDTRCLRPSSTLVSLLEHILPCTWLSAFPSSVSRLVL